MGLLHDTIIQNGLVDLKFCLYSTLPASQLLATTDSFTVSIVLPFSGGCIIGIVQHDVFSDWFLSLSNTHLSFFISFYGLIAHLLLGLSNIPLYGCTSLFIHPLTEAHLINFYVLTVMNRATASICTGVCVDLGFQLLWAVTEKSWLVGHIVRVCLVL